MNLSPETGGARPSLLSLYLSFFRVGAVMFGGGYAMLPLLEREVVDRRRWCRESEMGELYALAQSAPGVIAVNTALLVGFRLRGAWGGLVAALGAITVPIVVVVAIFAQLDRLGDPAWIRRIKYGLPPAVAGLLLSTSIRMMGREWRKPWLAAIGIAIVALALLLPLNPAWYILVGVVAGFALYPILRRTGHKPDDPNESRPEADAS
ncbi:MAG: chromate transporter [Kiritimatiellia bacterium]|jgi:chromate transporter